MPATASFPPAHLIAALLLFASFSASADSFSGRDSRGASHLPEWPALASPYRPELDPAERIAGLSRFWLEARQGFVWFDQVPDLDWDQAYLDFIPEVLAAADTADYYAVLMRFAALLDDAHSHIIAPAALRDELYSRPLLSTGLVQDQVLVLEVFGQSLPALGVQVGDRVLAVDGEPVADYARRLEPFVAASTPQYRAHRLFGADLLAGPLERPLRLQLEDAEGFSRELVLERQPRPVPAASESFEMRDGIAVLRIGQFSDATGLALFEHNLEPILGARGLILDLRGNTGGNTFNGWNLLTWLDAEPLEGTQARQRVAEPVHRARSPREDSFEWRRLEGDAYGLQRPQRYTGPVAMLVDAGTFSAAEDTAAAFKLMQRGAIIGSATAGSTGQPLYFDLPGGGAARICVKRDEYPDGSTFVGVGVLPDIEIQPSVADIRAGRDPVLQRALQHLAGSR